MKQTGTRRKVLRLAAAMTLAGILAVSGGTAVFAAEEGEKKSSAVTENGNTAENSTAIETIYADTVEELAEKTGSGIAASDSAKSGPESTPETSVSSAVSESDLTSAPTSAASDPASGQDDAAGESETASDRNSASSAPAFESDRIVTAAESGLSADPAAETSESDPAAGKTGTGSKATAQGTTARGQANALGKLLVALIDSGVNEDLAIDSVNMTTESDASDGLGHGTRMAQTILNNANGNAVILSVKALMKDGTGYLSELNKAISYAIDADVDIINLSLYAEDDGTDRAEELKALIRKAVQNGIIVVTAAGNGGRDTSAFIPANQDDVITVGAVDSRGVRNRSSNFGDSVDYYVSAPSTSAAAAELTGILAAANKNTAALAADSRVFLPSEIWLYPENGQSSVAPAADDESPAPVQNDSGTEESSETVSSMPSSQATQSEMTEQSSGRGFSSDDRAKSDAAEPEGGMNASASVTETEVQTVTAAEPVSRSDSVIVSTGDTSMLAGNLLLFVLSLMAVGALMIERRSRRS